MRAIESIEFLAVREREERLGERGWKTGSSSTETMVFAKHVVRAANRSSLALLFNHILDVPGSRLDRSYPFCS